MTIKNFFYPFSFSYLSFSLEKSPIRSGQPDWGLFVSKDKKRHHNGAALAFQKPGHSEPVLTQLRAKSRLRRLRYA